MTHDMQVARLYRYPVKSLSPEPLDRLEITDDGRVVGDRVFAFRFAFVNPDNPDDWLPKTNYASLQHIPELATLSSSYDAESGTLSIDDPSGEFSISGNPNDQEVRAHFSEVLSAWYATTYTGRNTRRKGGFTLVGHGIDGRHQYHDTKAGNTTMHSETSVEELAKALGLQRLDDTRFRSNIVIEGSKAWSEFGWRGSRLKVGDVSLKVIKPVQRCLATHVNPADGVRDADILGTLTKIIGQEVPQFAVSLTAVDGGGTIRTGDGVRVLG